MKNKKHTLLFPLFFALIGCASLGSKFNSMQVPSKDKALIYVYRPSAFSGSIQSPDLKIKERKVGTSYNGSYFYFEAKPGLEKITLTNFAGEEIGEIETALVAGNAYFLRLDLGIESLDVGVDSNGKNTGKKCSRTLVHFASIPGSTISILNAMDKRAQVSTCWPGFLFVTEDLAMSELPQTNLSK